MYKVNQQIILVVKTGFLIGMPLLCSFILSPLANYRILCLGLLLITFYYNHFYPDRIGIEDKTIHVKIFLRNEWLKYDKADVRLAHKKRCAYLVIDGKRRYRITMHRLPISLYEELKKLNRAEV